ncbi:MAG TPA: hypothetical protein VFB62_26585 [Polyangiaceae bacterium]|nr:hypothetical protein [Polyangiaceae bacterium]
MPEFAIGAAIVALLAGTIQLLAYFRAERRWRLGNVIAKHRHAVRGERRRAADALWHKVHVEGARHSLGSSIESPTELSATPELQTEDVVLIDAEGRRLRVLPGKKMRVLSLPGARRGFIEAMTTKSSVEQRFSFELDPDVAFKILGTARSEGGAQPFRDAPAIHLETFDGEYIVGVDTDEVEPTPGSEPGCGGRRSAQVVFVLNLVGAAAPFLVAEAGWAFWGLALVAAGLWLLGHLIDALDPPRLELELPEVQERVRAELGMTRAC